MVRAVWCLVLVRDAFCFGLFCFGSLCVVRDTALWAVAVRGAWCVVCLRVCASASASALARACLCERPGGERRADHLCSLTLVQRCSQPRAETDCATVVYFLAGLACLWSV